MIKIGYKNGNIRIEVEAEDLRIALQMKEPETKEEYGMLFFRLADAVTDHKYTKERMEILSELGNLILGK